MKKISEKELGYLRAHYPHLYDSNHEIVVTDDRLDGKQYCMILSDEHYVYCHHTYEREEILSMEISFHELSTADISHTIEKHGIEDNTPEDKMFKMLCIEDFFENNIY